MCDHTQQLRVDYEVVHRPIGQPITITIRVTCDACGAAMYASLQGALAIPPVDDANAVAAAAVKKAQGA